MAPNKLDIYVYAHWKGMADARLIGILSAHLAKGRKAFSFTYDSGWINSKPQRLLDPDIQFFSGTQFPNNKVNFGLFLDSMPDTWGRTLMKRRAAQTAKERNEKAPILYDIDYLLGVFDESRMGALRFKTDINGPFVDNRATAAVPPWSSVRELLHAAEGLENNDDHTEVSNWLTMLMAPGSSLGGARPKANVLDENNELWIAKFPSKNDTTDKAAWEYLAYKLAVNAGITMALSKTEKLSTRHHTFFTKRFDREGKDRIHFASAMTMTGNTEESIRDSAASYLDLAEFIQTHGVKVEANLQQLWRRLVFNIAISNTDDHLRNHGFLLTEAGWVLSPAYDLNPSIDKSGLALNIDMDSNALDYDLARSVGPFFRLNIHQMNAIIFEVHKAVASWRSIASNIGIPRAEIEVMQAAFRY